MGGEKRGPTMPLVYACVVTAGQCGSCGVSTGLIRFRPGRGTASAGRSQNPRSGGRLLR